MKRVVIPTFVLLALTACGEAAPREPEEKYRLVHAIGNTERVAARGLSQSECHRRRDELKDVATALGTYNEATGYGSITCLPESFFSD